MAKIARRKCEDRVRIMAGGPKGRSGSFLSGLGPRQSAVGRVRPTGPAAHVETASDDDCLPYSEVVWDGDVSRCLCFHVTGQPAIIPAQTGQLF